MCLAVPARVLSIDENTARVDMAGNERDCLVDVVPEVRVGDYVLMHAGYALQVLSREEAEETLQLLREAYGGERSGEVPRSGPRSADTEGHPAEGPGPG